MTSKDTTPKQMLRKYRQNLKQIEKLEKSETRFVENISIRKIRGTVTVMKNITTVSNPTSGGNNIQTSRSESPFLQKAFAYNTIFGGQWGV